MLRYSCTVKARPLLRLACSMRGGVWKVKLQRRSHTPIGPAYSNHPKPTFKRVRSNNGPLNTVLRMLIMQTVNESCQVEQRRMRLPRSLVVAGLVR